MNNTLIFGIYPGGALGTISGIATGKVENPDKIKLALEQLQPRDRIFLVRSYLHYTGNGNFTNLHPDNPVQYLSENIKLDLVLGYQPESWDKADWKNFIRGQIVLFGESLAKIQIAEEPNLHNIPVVDGDSPHVAEAVIEGIIEAKREIIKMNSNIQVGFNAVLDFNPVKDFWKEIRQMATPTFYESLDYVGLDFYPDVFSRIAPGKLAISIKNALDHFRNVNLADAGISKDVPVHISENGWPTGSDRSEIKQSENLDTIIRTIYDCRLKFNITHYELFDLRDANSDNPDFFYQFGIMKDDYTPKPAFQTFRRLIEELS